MATLYLDLEAGNDSNDGTSFANRKKTLAGASAIANPGDTVRIMASTTPNSLGVNGTFARGSTKITLASAVTQSIDEGESAWTPSANVTCATSTTRKQGSTSASIAIAAGFTTGLAAYKAFAATDFSSRQQLSFWFQQTAGTLGGFDIKLCSDAAGATPVDTFTIPAAVVLNGWNRVTINLGSAMSSSIQSVAFYVTADNGAQTYLLDNIVACNAPGTGELTNKTLIGKAKSLGAGGDDSETWYAIRAIEGTTVTLDLLNSSNAGSTTNGRYWGTSETVTAYSLFPSYVPTSVVSADLMWTAGGTDAADLVISGGWNRTDMSTQTGQTFCAIGYTPVSATSSAVVASYLDVSKFSLVMFSSSTWTMNQSSLATMQAISTQGHTLSGTQLTGSGIVFANISSVCAVSCPNSEISLSMLCDSGSGLTVGSPGCQVTITGTPVLPSITVGVGSKAIFNGTTYGSFGEVSAASAVRTNLSTELATIVKLDTALVLDGSVYQFTANALELGPSGGGGGGDATAANQALILAAIADVPTVAEFEARTIAAASYALAATALSTAVWTNGLATNLATTNTTVATNLNATVDSRATQTSVDDLPTNAELATSQAALATAANLATVAGYLDTEIAAILADTNELQADWANGGRLDTLLDTAAAGGGGSVAVASFDVAALAQLAALDTINVTGAVVRSGLVGPIVIGRDYLTADSQQLQFTNVAGSWVNLTGATIALVFVSLAGEVSFAGSVHTATGANQRVDVSLTAAQTATLNNLHSGYRLEATLTNGHLVRLQSGRAIVTE